MNLLKHLVFQNRDVLVDFAKLTMLSLFLLLIHHSFAPVAQLRFQLLNLLLRLDYIGCPVFLRLKHARIDASNLLSLLVNFSHHASLHEHLLARGTKLETLRLIRGLLLSQLLRGDLHLKASHSSDDLWILGAVTAHTPVL